MKENKTPLEVAIERLNPQQKEAVQTITGPVLVIAGAGSGKTSVLTARTANIMSQGIVPERILALTFTKKAAEEMRRRITAMVGEEARRLRMGTFHSVFISLLRPYAECLGFPYNFTILDEEDSLACLKRCIRLVLEEGRVPKDKRTKEQEDAYRAEDRRYKPKSVASRISSYKNELLTAEDYMNDEAARYGDTRAGRPLVWKIFLEYRNACFRSGTMDFDDILLYTDMLLANRPDICSYISASFDYILVDEYQDTNTAQYSILRRLTQRNKNICVVGDDSQSIYAFRGARIENILNFRKEYPQCRVIRLERNYRSTREIVDAANRLIAFNETRIPKTCFSEAEEGQPIELIELQTERGEADFIASDIKTRMSKGARASDFAILYRTNSQSRAMEDSLVRKGIPYVIYSGTSFFERMEVKDQMAYFKLAVNPDDDESFRRVVNKPARGVGNAALERLAESARMNGTSLWKAVNDASLHFLGIRPKAVAGLEQFRNLVQECTEKAAACDAYEAARHIADLSRLKEAYEDDSNEDEKDRADNIRELVDSVKTFEEEVKDRNRSLDDNLKSDCSLTGYLQNIMLLSDADTGAEDGDRVNMMTVHSAKGLEFPTVYVAGMEDGLFPLNMEGTEKEEEEERRLFYVAVTRAEKQLVLTRAEQRLRFGKRETTKQSKFIEQLMGELEYD